MYIVDFKRTPIGRFLGGLSHLEAPGLAIPLFTHFLKTYPFLKTDTDEVIMGNVVSAGAGMNPARLASHRGGVSAKIPAYTINHVCASGMTALVQGYRLIKLGEANLILAGGMESMSQAPHLIKGYRTGIKFGGQKHIDSLQHDGLYCGLAEILMGETAENIAGKYHLSREAQDQYALDSHHKAAKAQQSGFFKAEILEVGELGVDENIRPDTSLAKLASLKPVFKPKGSVTAGNSSSFGDGAGLALLASDTALVKYGLSPKAKIIDTVFVGLEPELMGMGPKYAIEKILARNSLSVKDIDLFEINEAFAAQVLAVIQELAIPEAKVNTHGGAVSLGHPLGMSGVRIVMSLINALARAGKKRGIASLCVGGGQGAAILLEVL